MKQNVLVFPCGSEIGLEIYKSLSYSTHFKLFGGSSVSNHGEFVYKNYIADIPMVEDPEFINVINGLIKKYNIDYIFPAHDSVVLKLAQEKASGNLNAQVVVVTSPLRTCEIARSKSLTYKELAGKVLVPKTFLKAAEVKKDDYPVFLKPDIGQGSKGVHVANNKNELDFYRGQDSGLLILEYLSGKEYTIDCFTNKDGELLFCEGRERLRINNGISVRSETVIDGRFKSIAENINKTITFRGAWFFQVKENKAQDLVLMEIATRIAGTMGLARCKGTNLPLLSLFDASGKDVSIIENQYSMNIDRALNNSYKHDIVYNHVYIDFDDLVILRDKVNVSAMTFIYQCINKGIKVYLITRHRKDLDASLKKYRLQNTFDKILWIKGDDEKHTCIKQKDAIFIDDSFEERKKVYDECGVPVFDAHMIESLME